MMILSTKDQKKRSSGGVLKPKTAKISNALKYWEIEQVRR
jgi:hypothetical protein